MVTSAISVEVREQAAARAAVRSGCSLPGYFYTSAERFSEDVEVLREKTWWLAGHASQIPKHGDYFLFDFANESIIVTRSKDGLINAFYNVCRHRGSRVCLEPTGNAKLMVCPYHAWSYNVEGALVGSPKMPAEFDKSAHGLHPAHVGVVDGVIFISLSRSEPTNFEAFAAPLRPFLAQYRLGHTKVAARDHVSCPANWKLVLENFAECYHCAGAHKVYARTHRVDSMATDIAERSGGEPAWLAHLKANGLYVEQRFDDIDRFDRQSGLQLQIGWDSLSGSVDGKPVAPKLNPDVEAWSGAWTGVTFGPMSQLICYDDYVILFCFVPRGPLETDCFVTWLVRQDALEGRDYDPNTVAYLWRHTFEEDKTICGDNQLGVLSSVYRPGPYSSEEGYTASIVDWYVRHFVDRTEQAAAS